MVLRRSRGFNAECNVLMPHGQYINLPMIAIGMIVCVFALPLKAVKGDIKSKLKKIDYGGSALTLAWAVLILLPLSW